MKSPRATGVLVGSSFFTVFIALFFACPCVFAATFHDAETGITMPLDIPGADICFAKPKEMRLDPKACEGLDLADLETNDDPEELLFAFVRFDEWSFTIQAASISNNSFKHALSEEDARDWISGVAKATKLYSVEKPDPDLLIVNDLQIIRLTLLATDKAAKVSTILLHSVFGKEKIVSVSFFTDAEHRQQVAGFAEKIIAGVKMPPVKSPATWTPRGSDAFSLGELTGEIIFYLVIIIVVGAGAMRLYRKSRRITDSGERMWSRQEIAEIAKRQHQAHAIFLLLLVMPFSMLIAVIVPGEGFIKWLALSLVAGEIAGILGFCYAIYKLARALRDTWAWIYVVATFIPLVNLISHIALSRRATKTLRANGIEVGLLGANASDMERAFQKMGSARTDFAADPGLAAAALSNNMTCSFCRHHTKINKIFNRYRCGRTMMKPDHYGTPCPFFEP